MNFYLILIISALVCFILAAIPMQTKINLGWAGAALLTAAILIGKAGLILLCFVMLSGCESIAVSGQACAERDGKSVCVGTDGKSVSVSARAGDVRGDVKFGKRQRQ